MIDTHTHIYGNEFDDDRDEVVARATAAGVTAMILPNEDVDSLPRLIAARNRYADRISLAVGLHPEAVNEGVADALAALNELRAGVPHVGIGEIGIDLYWDRTYEAQQMRALDEQLRWCVADGLPFIIHCREALPQVLEVLQGHPEARGVFHCFTGNAGDVARIRSVGDYCFGIGGVVTFKKSTDLREALADITLERIVLETDAPYLAPVPYRGKRNEPAYLTHVAEIIAQTLGVTTNDVDSVTTRSAQTLFNLTEQ